MSTQKYTVQYKSFESLMADIEDDLSSLSAEGYIHPDKYYKIIETCNSKLSIKINPIKEDVVTITNGKGKLPSDFKLLNSAFLCISYEEKVTNVENFNREYVNMCSRHSLRDVQTSCSVLSTVEDSKGMFSFVALKKSTSSWYSIRRVLPLHIKNSTTFCSSTCNLNTSSINEIKIKNEDGDFYIESNVDGEVYISYISQMIDDEGRLIILDHPTVREYYEYAVKSKIYENLWLNGTEEYQNKMNSLKEDLRVAKIEAISFVRMFDFAELKQVYFDNRKIFKLKYDKIIQE